MDIVQAIAIVVSGAMFIIIMELIRRNRLKERYSLIWLAAAFVLIVFSVWRELLHFIAHTLGVYYPPSFLFLLAICFLLLLLLHFSVVLSTLSESNKRLAQEVGILKEVLNDQRRQDNAESTQKEQIASSREHMEGCSHSLGRCGTQGAGKRKGA